MLSRDNTAKVVVSSAMQVAKRGSPSIIDISPSVAPGPTVVIGCRLPCESVFTISTLPWMISSM